MANLTTSADIDTFMGSADNSAARANLGAAGLGANTFTGQQILSTAGAASTPPLTLTGAFFTGGSATTTKPQFLIEPTGTTSTGWSTAGTIYGVNAPSGFVGDLFRGCLNGTRKAWITYAGDVIGQSIQSESTFALNGSVGNGVIAMYFASAFGWTSSGLVGPTTTESNLDTLLKRGAAAACIQMGSDAAPVTNQHFKACNRIISDGVGANLTISGGNGRGDYGGNLLLSYYAPGGSGLAGTLTTALTLNAEGFFSYAEGINLAFGSSTGTKIGTVDSQKLAFWNKTPIVQPTTAITAASFSNNTSGIVDDSATYGGYTMGQIAAALINVGILA